MENNVLKTGYRRLDDKYYGGIKRGELTMLYSRPGMGKSAFAFPILLRLYFLADVFRDRDGENGGDIPL